MSDAQHLNELWAAIKSLHACVILLGIAVVITNIGVILSGVHKGGK